MKNRPIPEPVPFDHLGGRDFAPQTPENKTIEDDLNGIFTRFYGPKWTFKNHAVRLDGTLLQVNSLFYPPPKEGGEWSGSLFIEIPGDVIHTHKRDFTASTLDELHDRVEAFMSNVTQFMTFSLLNFDAL